MKKPGLGCAVLISFALFSLARQGRAANPVGEQLLNGNFESFTDGLPNDWVYDPEGVGPAVLQSSAYTSPFISVYPAGNYSILLDNTPTASPDPVMYQFYTGFKGGFSMSFDFRLSGALQGNAWDVMPLSTSGIVPFDLLVDQGGEFAASDVLTLENIAALSPNTWYNVDVTGSISSGKYSGTITPYGGTAVSWSDYSFITAVSVFSGISIDNNGGEDAANTPVYFDNVSIDAVPEPSTAVLAVVGMLLVFKFRPAR